jgi:Zn finger protein HypA/HybF involved in hydrogenase expression
LDGYDLAEALDAIENKEKLPTVTPQQKSGKWIRIDKDKCKCDQCEVISFIAMYPNGDANYCPNCGAKMVEPQESEDKE